MLTPAGGQICGRADQACEQEQPCSGRSPLPLLTVLEELGLLYREGSRINPIIGH